MLRHKPRDKVINFALPACNRHAHIVGEWKANVKKNQPFAIRSQISATARVERALPPAAFDFDKPKPES